MIPISCIRADSCPQYFVRIFCSQSHADFNQAGDENPTKRALTWRRNAQFWGLWGETVL